MGASQVAKLPSVAVLGMGGVGGVLAASLTTAGRCRLSVVARGAGHARLCNQGLTVTLHEGNTIHCQPDIVLDAERLGPSPQDIVLVCTKSHQVAGAIDALSPLLGPDTVVVPCGNGLPWWYFHGTGGSHDGLRLRSSDPSGKLWAAVAPERVLGTVGMVSGDLDRSDGGGGFWRSKWPSDRNHIVIGDPAAGGGASARTDAVRDLFTSTEVPVRIDVASDIRSKIFDKLLINASLNTIGALTGTDCGQIVVCILSYCMLVIMRALRCCVRSAHLSDCADSSSQCAGICV
jgi:2-dehydropantoate 2-reductase